MLNRRPRWSLAALVLLLAACASPPAASTPAAPSATASPSPSGAPSEDAADPTGRFEAAIAGEAERSWDLELASWEDAPDGSTILTYGSGSEAGLGETVVIQIDGSDFSITTAGGSAYVAGNTADTCTVDFARQEEASVAGTFECPGIIAISSAELVLGPVDFTGSFEADR